MNFSDLFGGQQTYSLHQLTIDVYQYMIDKELCRFCGIHERIALLI